MKRCLSLVLLLCLLFSVSVSAVSLDKYNFNISLGEDYAVLTEDNLENNSELIEALGHSETSIKQYFKDNSLILFAVGGARQLQVTCRETEFSKRLGDISLLDDEEVLDLVTNLVKVQAASNLSLINLNGMKMYEVVSTAKDSGGNFANIQYITVRGGKLYTVSFFESADEITEDFRSFARSTIETLSIVGGDKATFSGAENITEMIIVGVLLVLAAAVAITLIISFVRDFIRYDENRHFIIRRRKK